MAPAICGETLNLPGSLTSTSVPSASISTSATSPVSCAERPPPSSLLATLSTGASARRNTRNAAACKELGKIGRVATKALDEAPYESLLVLDGVLGLSNLVQAREFNKAIPMSGLVLTKLDSSAKGGAVIPIEAELDVPVKLAGVGESIDDIAPFDAEAFVRAIFES